MMSYLDGIPVLPLALFLGGWLALLVTVLAWIRSRREPESCARCGLPWQRTARGAEFHLCEPEDDAPDLGHRLLSLSIRGANDPRGPMP